MPAGCCKEFYARIADDEPIFTLAGRDQLAPETVEFWIRRANQRGVNDNKLTRAIQHLQAIQDFQRAYPGRTKLPD
jgi:hypothetical protein